MIRKTSSKFSFISNVALWCIAIITSIIFPSNLLAQTSICFSIESESEQYISDGTFDTGSSDLELGLDNTSPQIVGLRYSAINIPANATVSNATIKFRADETSIGSCNLDFFGELTSNALPFDESTLFNVSNRVKTNSSVNWSPIQWIAGANGTRQTTPDVSPILNEILNTTGFNSGNAISFIVTGTGKRTALNSPIDLCVTYSLCGTPGQICDDGDPCTINDVWDNNCNCTSTPGVDSDNDGICDAIDTCPNSNLNDSDNDGVCDDIDLCLPGDDNVDIDNDNIPDDCDNCIDINQNNICDDVDPAFIKNVVINEVNYRSIEIQSDIDFIELYNAESTAIDLTGWTLTDAINYNFPTGTVINPGSYLVIAANPTECQAELNFSGAIGPYIGNLSSQSDNIVLRNENFFIVDKVDYNSWDEWPAVRYDDYEQTEPIPYSPANVTYFDDVKYKVAKSIQKTNPNLKGSHGGSWLASNPTPKAQNSNFTTNYNNLPVLKKVSKKPNNPTSGVPVVIKAAFDEFANYANIINVNLEYQAVTAGNYIAKSDNAYQNNWISLAMNDTGSGVDSLSNDGVYTVAIPSTAQVHRSLVRYRVKITTSAGYNKTYPDQNHTESNYAYYVYNGDANFNGYNIANLNPLQNITVITKASIAEEYIGNGTDNLTQYTGYDYLGEGTLVYNGEVYDHIRFRPRGKTRSIRVKPGIKFDLNDEHKIKVIDDCGNSYDTKRDKLLLSGTWVNDASSHGLVESVVYKILKLTKGIFKYCDYSTLRIVDRSTETGNNGDFWGLYLIQEEYDGDLLEEHNLPDGNIWSTYDPDGAPRFMYVDTYGDFTGSTNQSQWFLPDSVGRSWSILYPNVSTLDKRTFYGDRIANEIWANGETNYVGKHSYREYYNPVTNKWIGWCKDYDGAFGSGNNVAAVSTTNNFDYNAVVRHPMTMPPSIEIEYKGHLRSTYDLLLSQQQTDFLIDQETKVIYNPSNNYDWTTLDHSRWSAFQTYGEGNIDAQFQWYKNWFAGRSAYLSNDGSQGFYDTRIPNKPTITLTGSNAIDNLKFSTSSFTDPQGNNTFGSLQWRIGEWSDPSNAYYTTKCKAKYEIEDHWVSNEIVAFSSTFTTPPEAKLKVGRTYMARVRYKDNTGRWSHWSNPYTFKAQAALNQATPDIVINEINYNPAEECGTEFVEIYNNENYTVLLDNYELSDGVSYEFPAGSIIEANEYLVIAKDSIEFIQKYGFSPFGDYKNSLSNGGEQLVLEGPFNKFVNYFTYADDNMWDAIPDGEGPSLSLGNPALDNSLASNWTASKNDCGTPGNENNLCDNLQIAAAVINISCNSNDDGIITLSVNGGRTPYIYNWNGSNSNSNVITNLAPGNYSVTITDAFLCTTTESYTITEPTALQATASKTDETMYQANDGIASINVSGGAGPYTYDWSNGANTSTINNLAPGTYTVNVFDSKGCFLQESFTINAIVCNPFNINTNASDESMYQANDGSIIISISNGTTPYTFNWSNTSTSQNQYSLAPGSYTVNVTDAVGCAGNTTVTINPVLCNAITANVNITDDSCSGDGMIIISSITGGTTPYSILWSTGITGTVANNLAAGNYDLAITDVKGCPFEETYQVNSDVNISETIDIVASSSNTSFDGSIDITVTGGTAPYSFDWSNGAATEDLNNILPGNYNVKITDANNCSKTVNNIIVDINNCMPQIVQTDKPALATGLYRVSDFIESNAMIDNAENVSFKAGSYIELSNDFEVKPGAEFEAKIESCP